MTGTGGETPAGWYPDPAGNGERYWDGSAWTESTRQPTPGGLPAAPTGAGYDPAYATAPATGQQLPSTSGMATASMVLGILAIVFCWCLFIGPVLALVGIPLGAVASQRIKGGEYREDGKGQATAGLITSIIGLVLSVAIIVLAVAVG